MTGQGLDHTDTSFVTYIKKGVWWIVVSAFLTAGSYIFLNARAIAQLQTTVHNIKDTNQNLGAEVQRLNSTITILNTSIAVLNQRLTDYQTYEHIRREGMTSPR